MKWASYVLAYHGCDKAVGERVLSGGTDLRTSTNDYDWLGSGIYFWEGNPTRALEWAKLAKENPKISRSKINNPFVVGAVIDLGSCLDLLESESIGLVKEAHLGLVEVYAKAETLPPKNKKLSSGAILSKLDCAVINFLHSLREDEGEEPFDSVRAAFVEGDFLYPGSNFNQMTHLQLCIRNPACVVAYFRPKLPDHP